MFLESPQMSVLAGGTKNQLLLKRLLKSLKFLASISTISINNNAMTHSFTFKQDCGLEMHTKGIFPYPAILKESIGPLVK